MFGGIESSIYVNHIVHSLVSFHAVLCTIHSFIETPQCAPFSQHAQEHTFTYSQCVPLAQYLLRGKALMWGRIKPRLNKKSGRLIYKGTPSSKSFGQLSSHSYGLCTRVIHQLDITRGRSHHQAKNTETNRNNKMTNIHAFRYMVVFFVCLRDTGQMGLATIFVKINQRSDSIQFKLSLPGGCFIFFLIRQSAKSKPYHGQ